MNESLKIKIFTNHLASGLPPQPVLRLNILGLEKRYKSNWGSILSNILAMCLQRVIPTSLTPDQTGFSTCRRSLIFRTLSSPPPSNTPEVIIALDAWKAFDWVKIPVLHFKKNWFPPSLHRENKTVINLSKRYSRYK